MFVLYFYVISQIFSSFLCNFKDFLLVLNYVSIFLQILHLFDVFTLASHNFAVFTLALHNFTVFALLPCNFANFHRFLRNLLILLQFCISSPNFVFFVCFFRCLLHFYVILQIFFHHILVFLF